MDTQENIQSTKKYISYSNYLRSLSIEEYIKIFGEEN